MAEVSNKFLLCSDHDEPKSRIEWRCYHWFDGGVSDLVEHQSPLDPPGAAPLHTTSASGKMGTDTEETRT